MDDGRKEGKKEAEGLIAKIGIQEKRKNKRLIETKSTAMSRAIGCFERQDIFGLRRMLCNK